MSQSDATNRIVVIGAGQAAQALIEGLRKRGVDAPITLIGAEPQAPYQRPPLSKAYLLGEMSAQRLAFKPLDYYAANGVETRFGVAARAIDRPAKTVTLADGTGVAYGRLALVTGARANRLPEAMGGALPGVYAIRTLGDVDALAPEIRPRRRAVVVGGGYIGLEAAAVAAKSGLTVTLLEREPRILARVACAETADYFRALHTRHGVEIREGTALAALEPGPDGRVATARLADGAEIPADFVIAGVGVTPNAELAAAAGLETRDGVLVDDRCRTSDPDIVSAGDCARFDHRGASLRLESVQNALDQAQAAAANLAGEDAPYAPKPWFWSDQYDVKLQIAGLFRIGAREADRVTSRPGEREGGRSHWYFHAPAGGGAPQLWAVDAMNDPRAYMQGKRWIEAGLSPDPAALADPAQPLKTMDVHQNGAPAP